MNDKDQTAAELRRVFARQERVMEAAENGRLAQLQDEMDHEENLRRMYERFPKVTPR